MRYYIFSKIVTVEFEFQVIGISILLISRNLSSFMGEEQQIITPLGNCGNILSNILPALYIPLPFGSLIVLVPNSV